MPLAGGVVRDFRAKSKARIIMRLPLLVAAAPPTPRAAIAMQLEPPPVTTFEAQGDPLQAAILLSAVLLPFGVRLFQKSTYLSCDPHPAHLGIARSNLLYP